MGTLETPPGLGTTHLSDLLDLAASFANEGPALAGGDHKPEGDRGPAGSCAVGHGAADVLRGRGGAQGSALLGRHALGTCPAQGQGGDAGTRGPGQGDLGAFPVPFPRTSSAAQKKHRRNAGKQQPNSTASMETGLSTAPGWVPPQPSRNRCWRGKRDWRKLGDSTAPGSAWSLPLHQGSRQQLREKQSRRRLQRSCAAGGGEAQGQGSTDLLKSKAPAPRPAPRALQSHAAREDSGSLHPAQTAPSSAAFKAAVRGVGFGDRADSTGWFLPGSVPNPKDNRICTPKGQVRATELCPTPGEEHSQLLLPPMWNRMEISTLQPLAGFNTCSQNSGYPASKSPLEITALPGPGT